MNRFHGQSVVSADKNTIVHLYKSSRFFQPNCLELGLHIYVHLACL